MSLRTFRFVLAALAIAGGLALAAPNAEAAGRVAEEPDVWSLALRWVSQLWKGSVVGAWEMEGWGLDPHGSQPTTPTELTSDQGWQVDPNG